MCSSDLVNASFTELKLRSIEVNFGSVNLIMNYKEKISISTDHSYIYIEDNDASTYYKF